MASPSVGKASYVLTIPFFFGTNAAAPVLKDVAGASVFGTDPSWVETFVVALPKTC